MIRIVHLSLVLLTIATPLSLAGVEVAHDDLDFSAYRTYAWQDGTEAASPQYQQWIVAAVDRELARRGLRRAPVEIADLRVTTHAIADWEGSLQTDYLYSVTYDVGLIRSGLVTSSKGTLVVDLLDGDSEKSIWRAVAIEVMIDPMPETVLKKINSITRKMFKKYPKR